MARRMSSSCALITGASSGLGAELARLFARDGHDVVLLARDAGRLDHLAAELSRVHQVKAWVLPLDLADPTSPARCLAWVEAQGLEVEFLVNNAGYGSNGPFVSLPLDGEAGMVEVNCTALLKLTHLFAAKMVARQRGRVLNIASTAAFQAGPYMATYYATKAFVLSFSEALAHELAGTGVSVTCYCPGATATGFGRRAGNDTSLLFQQPGVARAADVAHDAYEALLQGHGLAVHGALNWLAMEAVRLSPRRLVAAVTAALNRP